MATKLVELEKELKNAATDPKTFFGSDPATKFQDLAKICHPDMNIGQEKRAISVFKLLKKLYDDLTSEVTITSKTAKYSFSPTLFASGDIADIYVSNEYLFKIVRLPKYNTLMDNEAKIVKEIMSPVSSNQSTLELVDTLTLSTNNRKCNVFKYDPRYIPFTKLLEKYKNGLDPKHIGWIFKRLLVQVFPIHQAGYVHGAILPTHALFNSDPNWHQCRLIDMTHAVPLDQPIKYISPDYKAFYPAEVLDKKPATIETDLYMIGYLCLYLMKDYKNTITGKKLAGFLQSLTLGKQSARPNDVIQLYEEWSDLLKRVFGPPKFVRLEF